VPIPRIDTTSTLKVEVSTTMAICEEIDSPLALSLYLVLKYEQWDEVLRRESDPLNYESLQAFQDDYLVSSLLKKSPNLPLGIDTSQAALDSFWESEKTCAEMNRKLRSTEFVHGLHEVKIELQKILGPLTRGRLKYVESQFKFGPGAQAFESGFGTTASGKFEKQITLTESLYPFYKSILGPDWWQHQADALIVKGNEYTDVLKNAKTRRGICKEPKLNSFVQLGVGALFRSILKRNGIDLDDQSRNQEFARTAYMRGHSTIDLKRASDSKAFMLVKSLLDTDWFALVDVCRSPYTFVEGRWHPLEKFSSMGNGYTFELESLIFLAMARSVVPKEEWHEICVYGDDLIVPHEYAQPLIDTLNSLGFEVNTEKSYLAGNFFESCGADFFKGHPVRPFYLRKDQENDNGIPQCLQIANSLRLYSRRISLDQYCDSRFLPIWKGLVKRIPASWKKCRGPASFGDSVLISSESETPIIKEKPFKPYMLTLNPKDQGFEEARSALGHEGRSIRYITLKPQKRLISTYGGLYVFLQTAGSSENATYGFLPVSRLFGLPKTSRSLVYSWDHGLDWCLPQHSVL